jgi:alpha-L-fucosidase 2
MKVNCEQEQIQERGRQATSTSFCDWTLKRRERRAPAALAALLACCIAVFSVHAAELNLGAMVQPVPLDSKFAVSNYYVWCGSAVKGDDGRYHLFYSRWPTSNLHKFAPGWAIVSEVAYAIGDSPRGPFTHVNVALPKRGTNAATGQKFWDADMTHNPYCIRKDGKWWLYYLGNYGDGTYNNHLNHDRIGVAVADNPAGPWTRLDQPSVDVSTNTADFDSLRLSNPAVTVRPDGKILMIYKAVTAASGNAVRFGACIADSPTNTYVKQASVAGQIFKAPGGDWMVAEDPFIWFSPNYDNQYYAVVRDVVGTFTGASGGLALFKSEDGLNWTNAVNAGVLGTSFKWANGSNSLSRIERPWVLLENNEPTVLFGATDGYDPGGRIAYNVQIPLQPLPASAPPVVTWTSPSADALGSMPLGNGDITLNAWCEPNGDLLFYIGKSDSWEDNSRLAKLGRVRVKLNPPLAPSSSAFTQALNPLRGEMTVTVTPTNYGATSLKVWADANNPVVHVQINAPSNVTATASFELWRTNAAALSSIEASDVNYDTSQPNNMHAPTVVEPDTVLPDLADGVGWYHRNNKSVGPNETMAFQDLLGAPGYVDPILGRTFGCLLRGPSFVRSDNQTIVSSNASSHRFDIYALTKFPATSNEWLAAIRTAVTDVEATPFVERYDAHVAWWSEFWNRSYIEITARTNAPDPAAATDVSTGYALQRFITACGGRGAYPIKFNGSAFTMPWAGKPGDADYRRWGGGYWWQNTRLPYASLCTSGDFDLLPSLFRMYLDDVLPVARYRAGYYYADPRFDDSCFMSEVTYPWGAVLSTSYGWTTPAVSRAPDDGKLQTGQYHKREWVGGLELSFMLLDYYDHTGDTNYLAQKILPATLPLVRWFERYYTNIVGGKLVMNPSQALETWWTCTNPMPEVAGLQAVVARLLALPTNLVSASDRSFLTNLQAKIPVLPTRVVSGTTMLAPAQSYASKNNIELPEQYAVYPFRLVSFEKTNAAWGVAAYDAASSGDKGANGWRQDDIFLAYLGLAERAKTNVISRARSKDTACRFSAFFGPNFDWTPDQCHGGVLMKAVQAMLLQTEGDKIFLLPAWPKDWDVKFKLHVPKQTTVEGVVSNGVLVSYTVTPPSRYNDVSVNTNFIQPFAGTPVSGYRLAWSDEFDAPTFDTNKWDYRTDSKHWSTQLPANLTVSNGILNLNLKKQTANGMDYTGAGAISKPAFRFGYYEARMRTPPGRGWHTSFWMMKHDGSGGTGAGATALELDCIENDSINPWKYGVNTHRWNPTPHVTYGGKTINAPTNGPSLTADFHIYGCEYTPTAIKYFSDGALVQTVDATTLPQGDLNIWLTSIASYLGSTTNVDDTQLPNAAQFDYVRFFSADTNTASGVSVNILSPGVGGATLRGTNVTLRTLAVVTTDDPAPVIEWTKLSGPGAVTFGTVMNADTTAKFSASGIYTLQCAARVSGHSAAARVSVNVLATGASGTNAPVQLRQETNGYSHLATFIRQDTQTWNSGARDQILVGKFNNGGFRVLLSYDLASLPTNALITGAQLDLMTHNSQAGAGTLGALELHPLNATFVEGTGDGSSAANGAGTGASWISRTGGTSPGDLWTNVGGDFATNILATAPGFGGATTSLPISFAMSSALGGNAQFAASAGQPWNLMLYSPTTEAGANGIFSRICSDDHATPTNRPVLTLNCTGNFAPTAAAGIAPFATTGMSTPLAGSVSNATSSVWSQLSGPGAAVFGNTASPATSVTFDAAGNYLLRLTASNAFAEAVNDLAVPVAGPPPLDSLTVSNGQFGFQMSGAAGHNYTVQASTNLVTWTNLFTTNPATMPFRWTDLVGSNVSRRFYRVMMGP